MSPSAKKFPMNSGGEVLFVQRAISETQIGWVFSNPGWHRPLWNFRRWWFLRSFPPQISHLDESLLSLSLLKASHPFTNLRDQASPSFTCQFSWRKCSRRPWSCLKAEREGKQNFLGLINFRQTRHRDEVTCHLRRHNGPAFQDVNDKADLLLQYAPWFALLSFYRRWHRPSERPGMRLLFLWLRGKVIRFNNLKLGFWKCLASTSFTSAKCLTVVKCWGSRNSRHICTENIKTKGFLTELFTIGAEVPRFLPVLIVTRSFIQRNASNSTWRLAKRLILLGLTKPFLLVLTTRSKATLVTVTMRSTGPSTERIQTSTQMPTTIPSSMSA